MTTKPPPSKEDSDNHRIRTLYKYRWVLTFVALASALLLFVGGLGKIGDFSSRVDSLAETKIENPEPKLFDSRTDIWFDPLDDGLLAYRDVEAEFIAEDIVLVAFEESSHPWGVFSPGSLALIQELTQKIEGIPYVRNVRSLTSSPWIRNGTSEDDEAQLVVTDLFDRRVQSFSEEERLARMVAVLGAEGASSLVGKAAVQAAIGDSDFSEHIGESRFIDSIISKDGRTAALQIQVIRQKADTAKMNAAFSSPSDGDRDVAGALHTIESQGIAVHGIREVLSQVEGRELHITGIPVVEQHFPEVGKGDMRWLGLMFVVIGLVLFVVYRRASGVVLPLLTVFGSILAMNGTVWLFGDLINNLTASAPVIMTAVGVADAVHLVSAYFILRPAFADKHELIVAVLKKNALPVFLTSLTTVVAFLSLTVSPIIPIKELGYTAALGTAAAYLLSMTMVPALLSLFSIPKTSKEAAHTKDGAAKAYWTDALAAFVRRRRSAILLTSVGILLVAGVGLQRLKVESDIRLMFPKDDPVVMDQNWIEAKLGGSGDLDLVFQGAPGSPNQSKFDSANLRAEFLSLKKLRGESLDSKELKELEYAEAFISKHNRGRIAASSAFLSQVDRFEARLEEEAALPGSPLAAITSFDSGLSVLRRMHQVQNENEADFYRVPTESDVPEAARTASVTIDPFTEETSIIPPQSASSLAAQYYLQYENGAKPAENLSPFVTPDRRSFRIAGRVVSESSADMLAAYARIRQIAKNEFPEITGSKEEVAAGTALSTLRLSGKHYLFMNMMERFTGTLVNSLAIALLVITLVIAFVFRSIRVAMISLVPNVLPLVVPLALFGIFGISLDGPAVIVATIALGICVDDTIHLLSRFHSARKDGETVQASIELSFRQVGGALTWTTVTLVLGFLVLSLSDFRPNMLIGAVGASMVALAWAADLVVVPALLGLVFSDKLPAKEASPEVSLLPAE